MALACNPAAVTPLAGEATVVARLAAKLRERLARARDGGMRRRRGRTRRRVGRAQRRGRDAVHELLQGGCAIPGIHAVCAESR